jgi:hypothetical protein
VSNLSGPGCRSKLLSECEPEASSWGGHWAEHACSGSLVLGRRLVMDRLRMKTVARPRPEVKWIVSYRLRQATMHGGLIR